VGYGIRGGNPEALKGHPRRDLVQDGDLRETSRMAVVGSFGIKNSDPHLAQTPAVGESRPNLT
jgi:hypothetical protein